jgi:radical SAM protein with 4Fe4S-binding SPASM domain
VTGKLFLLAVKLYPKDTRNFLQKLTPQKVVNFSKLLASYQMTRISSKPVQWGLPATISIEPTTACNLRCPECPSGLRNFSRPTGNLKLDFLRKTLSELSDTLMYLIFYFQGEPYINPDFLDMVKYAHSKNIYTITSTNGHFLGDENARRTIQSGLDRLIISVDGTDQSTYESYRKEGDLQKVLEGAANVIKWKKRLKAKNPHTIFQFLVVKQNEHQIPEIYRLANEFGIDEVKLKTAQIYDFKNGSDFIPSQSKYSRYRKEADGSWSIKNELLNRCWKLWHACVITWDGQVVPCCFDKDAKHKLGDLKHSSFRSIWQGDSYKEFRTHILKGRDQIEICTNCTEGCKVWAE